MAGRRLTLRHWTGLTRWAFSMISAGIFIGGLFSLSAAEPRGIGSPMPDYQSAVSLLYHCPTNPTLYEFI